MWGETGSAWGWGMGFGMIGMVLFWVLIIFGIVALMIRPNLSATPAFTKLVRANNCKLCDRLGLSDSRIKLAVSIVRRASGGSWHRLAIENRALHAQRGLCSRRHRPAGVRGEKARPWLIAR